MVEIYRDPAHSIEERTDDLLSRMNVDEKIAQLGGIWAMQLLHNSKFSERLAGELINNGIGQICRAGVGTTLSPEKIISYVNNVQHFLMENTRLGIPAIVHEECLNGFNAKQATIFPQIIGMGSTWDPVLIGEMAAVIRKQMVAAGIRQGLSPVLDIARDPRWGRIEETYGEDPYLTAEMGIAYVRALQGPDIKRGIVSTLKHFIGYGKSEGGLNHAPADIPQRMLREVYLYPFERVIKEAGALSIMNAYNEIDGIPCASSEELLTRILRDEWGFEGIVVSDYYAVVMLFRNHRIAATREDAAKLALRAGIDQELPNQDCMTEAFKNEVKSARFPVSLIDRSVRRVLKLKFMLGLFEEPYTERNDTCKVFDIPEHRNLALEAARESIVLLKNSGNILPLDKGIKKLAVIGPNADNPRNQLGDYTYPAHAQVMGMTAFSINCEMPPEEVQPDKMTVPVVSVLEGIKKKVSPSCDVIYARGCELGSDSTEGFARAVEAAGSAEAVVMVMGGKSGLTPECTCGEMRDRTTLGLPEVQQQLIRAVCDTGKPVILVIIDGRPVAFDWIAEKVPAIVEAWLPGEEGGNAVADILFGDYNPGGKLPISFPRDIGQLPVYYGLKPTGGKSQFWGEYVDSCTGPLFEFGFGLSYTEYLYRNLRIKPHRIPRDGKVKILADITNTGKKDGAEVVQLYINDVVASITRPIKELKSFHRIDIKAGQTRKVEFEIQGRELAFYDKSMKPTVEPGVFKVMIGASSRDIRLEGYFEVTP
ncbi:MAG: glycoside hydrolase family 3 N-terminal domain-containing protein [Dehalococcoidia bacterium]|jgi:beta-glucosidase